MSCEIRTTACLQSIPLIRRCLFPTDDKRGSDSWLQLCEISASPTGDLIAIANERRLVVLTAKWDSASSTTHFHTSFTDSIHEYDKVKAVLCLPIVSQTHSTRVGPDWTCILIGYDSGYIRFYTENCELLMEEQLHSENISSIKCQSQHSPRPDISPDLHPEEIYVQYQSNVCVLNGAHLFTSLRNARIELAKAQAKGERPSSLTLQQPPLNPKKWGFQDQAIINDTSVVGLNLSNTFDHLLTASTYGGFDTKYRATAPNSTLVVTAGSKPFLGFHYALEGVNMPVLSDVAKVVASKLKSALPGWLTGNKTQQEKQMTVAMQPVDTMGCRFGLCDLRRTANSIVLCQNKRFAAVTDSLGRVLLTDCFRGVTLRVFKGYREAQCSFIQVPDDRKSKHRQGNKVAQFLVIYSPKKGTLEIFTVQQGTRIAVFSASKHSRLLHINYGLMGFTTTSKSRYVCQYTTIFIDNDGQIKEMAIPFHFAVPEKNSKRAKDIHLYKKLKHLIKCGELDTEKLSEESIRTCSELKTSELKTQTVEMLLNNKDVPSEVMLKCLDYFLDDTHILEGPEIEINNFKTMCTNARLLLSLYDFTTKCDSDEENGNHDGEEDSTLSLKSDELKHLQKLLDLTTVNNKNYLKEAHVSFADTSVCNASDFLSAFDLTKTDGVRLKQGLDDSTIFKTSEVIFSSYITGQSKTFDELEKKLLDIKLPIRDVFLLAINYWVNRSLDINLNLEKEMNNFSLLIGTLVRTASIEVTDIQYETISKFWSEIREILTRCARPFPALMAAILCRSWAHNKEKLEGSATSFEEEMEMLSHENIQWALLIGKLEDVSTLNIIISGKPTVSKPILPKLNHNKFHVSLTHILQKGRGAVSELVAQWLTSSGINPTNIVINDIVYKNSRKPTESNVKTDDNQPNIEEDDEICEGMYLENIEQVKSEPIFEYINLLKTQFPYSLDGSTLLANMCWEYALAWQKDITKLENLEASIRCLTCIKDANIQQGIHQLVWNTHLKIVLESSCKLINKVGKLPKDRLCQQDTSLSDKQIISFIGICTGFIESFLDVCHLTAHAPKTVLQFEAIWENSSTQPLVELAIQQREIDYNLLFLHYQLMLVLHMITTFSVKHTKPVNNLFDSSVASLFFTDLTRKVDVNMNKSDLKVNSSRSDFLLKVISASMESVTINENGTFFCKDHVDWMAKCMDLARIWNLDLELLKRHQIIQLYTNGFDAIAEELIPAANDLDELGEQLLMVTSRRLKQYLASSPNLAMNMPALTTVVTRHLETLDGTWCTPSPISSIVSLARQTVYCLSISENQNRITRLADLLLEGCTNLEEINS